MRIRRLIMYMLLTAACTCIGVPALLSTQLNSTRTPTHTSAPTHTVDPSVTPVSSMTITKTTNSTPEFAETSNRSSLFEDSSTLIFENSKTPDTWLLIPRPITIVFTSTFDDRLLTPRSTATRTHGPIITRRPATRVRTANPVVAPTKIQPTQFVCPRNCTEARQRGVSSRQAAACGLDGDGDGHACYE
jgi:hypothetical protein